MNFAENGFIRGPGGLDLRVVTWNRPTHVMGLRRNRAGVYTSPWDDAKEMLDYDVSGLFSFRLRLSAGLACPLRMGSAIHSGRCGWRLG